jgi:MFS family permease
MTPTPSTARGVAQAPTRNNRLPRAVWLLGWASFATDLASEAIYPLLPLFLTRLLGAGPVSLGLIEGVAEATASLVKVVSGRMADRWRRKPLVLAGYGLSGAVRPLMAMATAWWQVLGLRFLDRVGKGVRGAPRDAMLAAWADPARRGWVYGFHRAMDHGGAVAGPLFAAAFLWLVPEGYRALFATTVVPGAIAMLLLARVPESADVGRAARAVGAELPHPTSPIRSPAGDPSGMTVSNRAESWRDLPGRFWSYLGVLALFTLGNSSDAFLLLRLSDVGLAAPLVPLVWAAHHIVKAGASLAGGRWSDRADRRTVITVGWTLYAIVYAVFAFAETRGLLVATFLLYGVYFGLTEGPERALVADLVPPRLRGTAFGFYGAILGVGALAASVGFGAIWHLFGSPPAFLTGAALALAAAFLLSAPIRR